MQVKGEEQKVLKEGKESKGVRTAASSIRFTPRN